MPWLDRTIVTPTQNVGIGAFRASTIVGTQPPSVWGDDSDATYAYSEQEYGTLVGNVSPEITVALEPQLAQDIFISATARVAVWMRYDTNGTTPLKARLTASPGANYRLTSDTGASNGLPAPAGWTVVELMPTFWTAQDTLTSWRNGSTHYLTLQQQAPEPDPPGAFSDSASIYEARVVVYADVPVYSPGRLFPRDDDLGVGSGRHFPPPKSQQRSGRRFGYY